MMELSRKYSQMDLLTKSPALNTPRRRSTDAERAKFNDKVSKVLALTCLGQEYLG